MLRKLPFKFIGGIVGALLIPTLAPAAVNLKKVNIVDGNQIELLFDGKLEPAQVKTEFVRDNIQLSLSNTSVYPAKVSMVSGSDLTKVFAYQYAPALVRARFTVKGDATNYANRLQIKFGGKSLLVKISNTKGDQVAATSSSALRVANAPEEKTEKPEKIEKAEKPADAPAKEPTLSAKASTVDSEKPTTHSLTGTSKSHELAGGKALPSPLRSIGVMLFVLGVFGLFVMFLKRLKTGEKSAKSAKGLGGFLNKLSGGTASKELIEVVATHHLGPKRSIVVVRIQDRMLVMGMTGESMNLITEFKSNEEGDADENIPLGDFAASLKKFETQEPAFAPSTKVASKANLGDIAAAALGLAKPKPTSAPRTHAAANAYQSAGAPASATSAAIVAAAPALTETMKQPSVKSSIRAQIKDRVQGMKQL